MCDLKKAVILEVINSVESICRASDLQRNKAVQDSQDQRDKMESGYDSSKEEAGYLIGGHDRRHVECSLALLGLRRILDRSSVPFDEITVGSLVEMEVLNPDPDERTRVFYCLLPYGGGQSYEFDNKKVFTIDPNTPLAQKMKGCDVGDEIDFVILGKEKYYRIVSVQ